MTARARTRPAFPGVLEALNLRELATRFAWPMVLLLGISVRAFHVLRSSFPLNDGGLFFVMAGDIQRHAFALPDLTTYNGGEIPFAYPPAALYLIAALDVVLPVSLLTLFRVLPLLGAIATLFAFAALARTLLRSEREALIATAAFGLMPAAFAWMLPGGGLPRGFALALALLATRQAYGLVSTRREPGERLLALQRPVALTTLFAAGTLLCHLETAAFLGITFALVATLRGRGGLARLGSVAILTAAVTAPWWGVVVARHGLEPFLASMDQGGALLDDGRISWPALRYALLHPISTGESELPLLSSVAMAGGLLALLRGRLLLPLWCVSLAVVAMRASPTFGSVPAALLVGLGAGALFDAVARLGEDPRRWTAPAAVLGGCLLLAASNALAADRGPAAALHPLPEADRAAMTWAAANIPPDARFVVVPATGWWVDSPSEWFPAIARRESLATPQGNEWLKGEFAARLELHGRLSQCAEASVACLDEAAGPVAWTHVYVPAHCCQGLKDALRVSGTYTVDYDRSGVLIARRR
ncbi:MAG: hypothetical protein WD557_16400 [Dehalococcoidia bacterium]